MKLLVVFSAFTLVNAFGAVSPDLRNLPISFEPNEGQFSNDAQFGARAPGLQLSVSHGGVRFETRQKDNTASVQMTWKNGSRSAAVQGEDELPGKTNYIFGSDQTRWKTNLPTYRKVAVHGIYKGVDIVLYGNRSQLEYDLVLAPGADVAAIDLQFKGADRVSLSKDGDLLLHTGGATFEQHRPRVFQERDGRRVEIASKYVLRANGDVGFDLNGYDQTKQVVIDPVLSFSTIFGGNGTDNANAIALDSSDNIYLAGDTTALNFPTVQAYQNATLDYGSTHMFVMKLDSTGTTVLFSTYLAGTNYDSARSLAVDSMGNVFITGSTRSADYPVTPGAMHFPNSGQAYVSTSNHIALTKLDASGSSLVFSAVLGGSMDDEVARIAIDAAGNSFLTGYTRSTDFPVTSGARNDLDKLQTQWFTNDKIFATKVNASGTSLIYSAVIGGSGGDDAAGLAVDSDGSAYIAGTTTSVDFPVTSGAYQVSYSGFANYPNGFVLKLAPDASNLIFATYLGGSQSDSISALSLDAQKNIYVAGVTGSSDFPTISNSYYAPATGSQNSAFVTKLKPDGSGLIYSAVFGGHLNSVADLAVNTNGEVSVVGAVDGAFPTSDGAPQVIPGTLASGALSYSGTNAFILKLTDTGQNASFATYLGGVSAAARAVAVNGSGGTYVTGIGDSTFPTTAGAFRTVSTGEIFLAEIQDPSSCTYTTEQGSDALHILVTTQPGCNWIAVPGASWLGIGAGRFGSGSGTVQILEESNNALARSGELSIAGAVYSLNQAAGCQLTLSMSSQTFAADGGSGQITGAIASGCVVPMASTSDSWIHLNLTFGSSYSYSVDLNDTGASRAGTVVIGTQTFTVVQNATACEFQVSPTSLALPTFGNASISVTANFNTCPWTASTGGSNSLYIGSGVGQGSSSIGISAYNPFGPPKTVFVTVAGQRISVTIQGTGGAYIGGKIGVFRSGAWWIDRNADNNWTAPEDAVFAYGYAGDIPILGDWDNTGKLRIGVFRSGEWWVDLNGDNSWDPVHDAVYSYGQAGDIPVVADWNNTGRQRIGVFRNGQWWVDLNGDHIWSAGVDAVYAYGQAGDIPVVGDWTNSGMQRIGVFRGGQWWLDMNGDHTFTLAADSEFVYGIPGDMPVMGDWDGTGRQRIGVLRNGDWWLDIDGDHQWTNQSDRVFTYGFPGDIPVILPWP
ncbi:MAG TPA: SBBP repeat-containing protein [Bryobacteraceae bacterium]|nr:SBBP repeat-containing protein [Bryobacteraceae bacterium]